MTATSSDALTKRAARARLQGKRAALGLVMAVAAVFVGISSVQIVPAIFGTNVTPLPASGRDPDAATCAMGIRDRIGPAGPPQREPQDEDRVRSACEKSAAGLDAWASLARLRSAQRQLKGSKPEQLDPLRRDVAAHLPADLR